MIRIILLFTIMTFSQNIYSQDLKVVESDLARKMMSQSKPTFVKKISKNNCDIYKLGNDNYIVYSPLSRYSILFSKLDVINKVKDFRKLPIGIETDDVRELEQDKIINIQETIQLYVKELELKFGINLSHSEIDILGELDKRIFDFGIDKLNERDIFAISLYLDDFFRINTQTHWIVEKVFTLKTYWIPFLKDSKTKKEYSFYRAIFDSYYENDNGYLNLKLNYLLQLADFKNLAPLSPEHINFINSYNKL